MKKMLSFLILATSCLTACGEKTFVGKYKFLLGRQGEGETRVSVEMELTDEDSSYKEGYKNMHANFELSGIAGGLSFGDDEDAEFAAAASQFLVSLLKEDGVGDITEDGKISLNGFYNVSDLMNEKYGNKVRLAFNLTIVNELLTSIGIDPTDIVQNFIVSYCDGNAFTLQVPVSLDDVQQQLLWYGTYIDYNPYIRAKVKSIQDIITYFTEGKLTIDDFKIYDLLEYEDHKLIGEQNPEVRFGSHPVIEFDDDDNIKSSQVIDVNQKYQGLFSNTFVYENNAGEAGERIGTFYFDEVEKCYYFYPLNDATYDGHTAIECIVKEDVGVLDYDFSLEKEVELWVTPWTDQNTGKVFYMFGPQTHVVDETADEWDWKRFYQQPFEFRDFHDIKINLKKD